jgi:Domain of unknown function (DUF5664)
MTNDALRYDAGKPPIHMVPPECIEALALHYGVGAKKYAEYNWAKGMLWTRCYDSLMRHALAWMRGEDIDKETGTSHLICVAWNALTLFWYQLKNVGVDDRPKFGGKNGKSS